MDSKNLASIFFTANKRLSSIIRYNTTLKIRNESVAEHSYFVAFYAMMLADFIEGINKQRVLELCLIHDYEESLSGDIPHYLKMEYPEMNNALETMNKEIMNRLLYKDEYYIKLWEESRGDSTLEAKLLLFCDKLSCLIYAREEVSMGNKYMKDILDRVYVMMINMIKGDKNFSSFKNLVDNIYYDTEDGAE